MVAPATGARSVLVTNLGWLLVVAGGICLAYALFGAAWMGVAGAGVESLFPGRGGTRDFSRDWARGYGTVVLLQAVVSLAALALGYGLLRRNRWARRLLVALLALCAIGAGVVALLAFALLVLALVDARGDWAAMLVAAAVGGVFMTIGVVAAILIVWLIRELRSPAVLQEFAAA